MPPRLAALKQQHAEHLLEVLHTAEKQEAERQRKLQRATSKANLAYLQKRYVAWELLCGHNRYKVSSGTRRATFTMPFRSSATHTRTTGNLYYGARELPHCVVPPRSHSILFGARCIDRRRVPAIMKLSELDIAFFSAACHSRGAEGCRKG